MTLVGLVGAQNQNSAAARRQIEAQYKALEAGVLKKSWPAIKPIFTSSSRLKTREGQVLTLKQIEQNWNQLFKTVRKVEKAKFTIKSFRMEGAEAVTMVTSLIAVDALDPQTKKPVKVELSNDTRVRWVNRGGWRINYTEQLTARMKINGQEIAMPPEQRPGSGG